MNKIFFSQEEELPEETKTFLSKKTSNTSNVSSLFPLQSTLPSTVSKNATTIGHDKNLYSNIPYIPPFPKLDIVSSSSSNTNRTESTTPNTNTNRTGDPNSNEKDKANPNDTPNANSNAPLNKSGSSSINDSTLTNHDYLNFLPNPHLTNLPYVESQIPIYANLFKLELKKNYDLYEYAINFIFEGDNHNPLPTFLKRKIILKVGAAEILPKYGSFIFLGSSFYAMKKFTEISRIRLTFNSVEYLVDIQPTSKIIEMKKDTKFMIDQYLKGKLEIKTIYEVMVREILTHNPSLKYVMNLFGNKEREKVLYGIQDYNSINIIPGYSTRVMILENGIYLNVDLKTKILSNYNCLQLINTFPNNTDRITSEEKQTINDWFLDKTVETTFSNQRFKIQEVNFDRTPANSTMKKEGRSICMKNFYKECYNIELKSDSPLLKVKTKNKGGNNAQFLPPEVCRVVGLSDEMILDSTLTKNITRLTKLNPDDRINSTNDIIKLMNETKPVLKVRIVDGVRREIPQKSSFQVKEEYGLDIISEKEDFYGQIMKLPSFVGGEGKDIRNIGKTFNVSEAKEIKSICLFYKRDEKDARDLKKIIENAAPGYRIDIGMNDFKRIETLKKEDWIYVMEKAIKHKGYNLIIFLVDDNNQNLYEDLKIYTQEKKGIITQFIKTKSFRKNGMSVVSNILIQMNTKIGGVSYKVKFSPEIMSKKLMIVGVETSGYEDNKNEGKLFQSISFCATINDDFTKYTNQKMNIMLEDFDNTNFPIANFMEQALLEYFKFNKDFPGGVVIYRQGTSSGEKKYLSYEIEQLQKLFAGESEKPCFKGLKIPYYYITVNKKTSLKFYEINKGYKSGKYRNNDKGIFENPDSGLLVIDKLVNPNRFEFYIQPQKVSQGSATPTCYQVEFGNMDCPEIVPKLTFDLCFLYSNWRGPVRIPSVLKYAEKLAKAKAGVNEKIKNTLSYI